MSESEKVITRWSEVPSGSFERHMYWLAVPEVNARYTRKAVEGLPYRTWSQYCVGEFLQGRTPVDRMLSVGCGAGGMERELESIGCFRRMDGIDVTPALIEKAREQAAAANLSNITYHATSIEEFPLEDESVDVVWFNGSLHHINSLESTFPRLSRALKPGGYLFANEYIGASYFDLSPRQKEVIIGAHFVVPRRLRTFLGDKQLGELLPPQIPDPAEVREADPSEAVRAAEIVPLLKESFDVLKVNPAGGTILQFLLSGIAGHFRSDDPDSIKTLNLLFAIEDTLLELGDLPSDFAVIVARKSDRV